MLELLAKIIFHNADINVVLDRGCTYFKISTPALNLPVSYVCARSLPIRVLQVLPLAKSMWSVESSTAFTAVMGAAAQADAKKLQRRASDKSEK